MLVIRRRAGQWIDLQVVAIGHAFRLKVRKVVSGDGGFSWGGTEYKEARQGTVELFIDDPGRKITVISPERSDAGRREAESLARKLGLTTGGGGRLVVRRPEGAWTQFIVDETGHRFRVRAYDIFNGQVQLAFDDVIKELLIERSRVGDSEAAAPADRKFRKLALLTPEGWEKVAAYQDAMYRMVAPYAQAVPQFAPAIEDAVLQGLAHAVLTHEDTGADDKKKFYAWAQLCVRSRVSGAVSKEKRKRQLDKELWARSRNDDRRMNGEPIPPEGDPAAILPVESEEALAILKKVKGRHRRALRLRFVDGLTQSDVAKVMGLSQSKISTLINEGLHKLGRAVGVDPNARTAV